MGDVDKDQFADEKVLRWTKKMNDEAIRIMTVALAEVPEADEAEAVAGFARMVLEQTPGENRMEKMATLYADAIYRLMQQQGDHSNG